MDSCVSYFGLLFGLLLTILKIYILPVPLKGYWLGNPEFLIVDLFEVGTIRIKFEGVYVCMQMRKLKLSDVT